MLGRVEVDDVLSYSTEPTARVAGMPHHALSLLVACWRYPQLLVA